MRGWGGVVARELVAGSDFTGGGDTWGDYPLSVVAGGSNIGGTVDARRMQHMIEWNMFEINHIAELRLYGLARYLLIYE